MATRFIPTVERESIDMVYALFIINHVSELMNKSSHTSDRNVAG